jgi:DNA-binding transcriptional LysR family regulator
MSFTLRQLTYFVAVAEHGSVSAAAHSLSISQSAMTEAVKDLEADLGVKLFDRHSRGLRITHRGHQFLRHATTILAEVSGARRAFDDEGQSAQGKLHLGLTSLVAGYVISDLLAKYRRANPKVEISAIEESSEYLEHLLIGGEMDVAVMMTSRVAERHALYAETLDVSPYRLWMPLGHRLTNQDSINLSDLRDEPLIMLNIDEMEQETVKLLSVLGTRPKVAFRTRSVEAVRSLVATGAGVALLPDLVYRPWSLEGDRIEARDVSGSLPVVQVGLVWRKGSKLSAAAREFVAVAQAHRMIGEA